MRKNKPADDDLKAEYTRANFKGMVRGKYYERVKASSNVVVIDDDLTAEFPNSEAVNNALHALVKTRRAASILAGKAKR